ncbi:MAG: hypothetical protein VB095_06920 [Anaerovorax sp.]|nr:hypothetical protein [Anaerovorax sp.]
MKNLIAFHGSDHKVGTTMISQSVAELISKNRKDIKILWVVFATGDGKEYANYVSQSLEGLRLQMYSQILNDTEVMHACKQSENLYMLGGIKNFLDKRNYFPEMTKYFLNCIKDKFDLVIADCGNDLDCGLTTGALESSGLLYLIVSQRESSLRQYELKLDFYRRLDMNVTGIIVNHFQEDDPLTLDYIGKRFALSYELFFRVQDSKFNRQAEMNERSILSYGDNSYYKDIAKIADSILKKCELGCLNKEEEKRKKRWISFI